MTHVYAARGLHWRYLHADGMRSIGIVSRSYQNTIQVDSPPLLSCIPKIGRSDRPHPTMACTCTTNPLVVQYARVSWDGRGRTQTGAWKVIFHPVQHTPRNLHLIHGYTYSLSRELGPCRGKHICICGSPTSAAQTRPSKSLPFILFDPVPLEPAC
jgi:hypothetical protein